MVGGYFGRWEKFRELVSQSHKERETDTRTHRESKGGEWRESLEEEEEISIDT